MSLDMIHGTPRKMTRILVYPNITFAKDIVKDSFVQYLATVIAKLNTMRDDLHFTVWMPEPVGLLNFENVHQVIWPLPTHAPAMRVHFDVPTAKRLLSHDADYDIVWSHLPEQTHAICATIMNLTHHRPAVFGYAHWFDLSQVATWDGASFRENISGLLHMHRCYLNTNAQKRLVLEQAATTFAPAICQQLDKILVPQALGIPAERIVSTITPNTDKVIVFNHRPDPYKDFPSFLRAMRELRKTRQDFTVWIPLLDTAPEPWIVVDKFSKEEYYKQLRLCRVGIAPKQTYAGWSLSATDGLMNGCPYMFYDADYYAELHPTADTFGSWPEALTLLHRYLDDEPYRNDQAQRGLIQAATLSLDSRMEELSAYITALAGSIPSRTSDTVNQLTHLIRSKGTISKSAIIKSLGWGRGISWTPYRRALLAHPNIFDTTGTDTIYQWVE